MPQPVMTYELAMAASRDAGNERMRKAGRTAWSVGDYNHAVRTFEKLWPKEKACANPS